MIVGPCPYEDCDEPHMIPIAEFTPVFSMARCDGCDREYWVYHSRIDPEAYTLEQFAQLYNVDDDTRTITRKGDQ